MIEVIFTFCGAKLLLFFEIRKNFEEKVFFFVLTDVSAYKESCGLFFSYRRGRVRVRDKKTYKGRLYAI